MYLLVMSVCPCSRMRPRTDAQKVSSGREARSGAVCTAGGSWWLAVLLGTSKWHYLSVSLLELVSFPEEKCPSCCFRSEQSKKVKFPFCRAGK